MEGGGEIHSRAVMFPCKHFSGVFPGCSRASQWWLSWCRAALWPGQSWEVLCWFINGRWRGQAVESLRRKGAYVCSSRANLRAVIEGCSLWELRECFRYATNAHRTLKMTLSLCARCQLCISGCSLLFSEVWFNLGKLRSFLFWKDRMSISLDVWPAADDHTSNWQSAPKVHAFTLSCLLAFPFAWCMAVVKFQQRWVSQSRLFQRWKATKNLPSSFEWLTGER